MQVPGPEARLGADVSPPGSARPQNGETEAQRGPKPASWGGVGFSWGAGGEDQGGPESPDGEMGGGLLMGRGARTRVPRWGGLSARPQLDLWLRGDSAANAGLSRGYIAERTGVKFAPRPKTRVGPELPLRELRTRTFRNDGKILRPALCAEELPLATGDCCISERWLVLKDLTFKRFSSLNRQVASGCPPCGTAPEPHSASCKLETHEPQRVQLYLVWITRYVLLGNNLNARKCTHKSPGIEKNL